MACNSNYTSGLISKQPDLMEINGDVSMHKQAAGSAKDAGSFDYDRAHALISMLPDLMEITGDVSMHKQADRMDTCAKDATFLNNTSVLISKRPDLMEINGDVSTNLQFDRMDTSAKDATFSVYDQVATDGGRDPLSISEQLDLMENNGDTLIFQPTFYPNGASFDVLEFFRYKLLYQKTNPVTAKSLEDKMVMICFICLPLEWPSILQAVLLLSSELHAFGAFEIVLFITGKRGDLPIDLYFSFLNRLPSFCIVASYTKFARREVIPFLNLDPSLKPVGLLVNRNKTVVWHKRLDFLVEYGVDAFPFTPERLTLIAEREKGKRALERLNFLLCSDPLPFPRPSSFLRKNPGGGVGKVRLSCLDSKLVGLYLCQTGSLIPTLDEVQKKCSVSGLEFEVILVYMPFNDFGHPRLFQNRINTILKERKISWWVLPFVNWVSRKLWRICHKDADDRLIIVDPKARFVELHGEAVIRHFGIAAYPFSTELLFNKEFERLRSVTFESLLVYGLRDYVLWRGSDFTYSVPVGALRNKNILLYLHCVNDDSEKILNKLISCCEAKVHDPDLELVVIGLDKTSFDDFESSCAMPCLVCPFDSGHADLVSRIIFGKAAKCSTIVGFRKDGHIFSLHAQQLVCSSCSDNLYPEITAELAGSKIEHLYSESTLQRSRKDFEALVPLLEKEYFFPSAPLAGRIQPATMEDFDNEDEDERDNFFSSRIDYTGTLHDVAQYPNEIQEKIPNIDTKNFDVVSFLSAENMLYLLRNDKPQTPYEVKNLGDKKWVMICCFFCPMFSSSSASVTCTAVSRVCYELYDEYGDSFEMVLVFMMRKDFQIDESAFDHMLSGFPSSCLFVPFIESHSRHSICHSLGFRDLPNGIFVRADERRVIWHKRVSHFKIYGVDAFPFTDIDAEKIASEERKLLWNSQSLEKLFCCPSSEILHESKCTGVGGADCCETISIEQLKEKVVGVYLCYYGDYIPMLHGLYECCKANNIEFEIVVVYCPFSVRTANVELFQKKINRGLEKSMIPCRVLPFKSWVSLRLKRLCLREIDEELIIVGKGIVDPHGVYFMRQFARIVYPEEYETTIDAGALKEKIIHEFKARYLGGRKHNISDEYCCRPEDRINCCSLQDSLRIGINQK